eukprot:scaffold405_cov132-Cylindrotheca_fusiformis.AAC.12
MKHFSPSLVLSLAIVGTWLKIVASQDLDVDLQQPSYRAEDDASWAIQSNEVSTLLGDHVGNLYETFIANCKKAVLERNDDRPGICVDDENHRMLMNKHQPSSVYNFTKHGYAKIRAPPKLFELISEFYRRNQGQDTTEWKQLNTYHNIWDAPPTICLLNRRENSGGGPHLQATLFGEAEKVLEEWTGQELSPVSLYGVRLYHNGSILAPHVDRMPLVTSAIINVDQDVDEPWPLEVYGHDGVAINITMEPGDMVRRAETSMIMTQEERIPMNAQPNLFSHTVVPGFV